MHCFSRHWDEPCFQFLPWSFWSTSVARRLVLLMETPERRTLNEWQGSLFHWESNTQWPFHVLVCLTVCDRGWRTCMWQKRPWKIRRMLSRKWMQPRFTQVLEGEIAVGGGGWTSVLVCLRLSCFLDCETFSSKSSTVLANRDGWASWVLNFPYLHKRFTVSWKLFPITFKS